MTRRQQHFEPEMYLQKAEDDIRRVQMLCSLTEPSWDGYCGLVLLNEDNFAECTANLEEAGLAGARQDSKSKGPDARGQEGQQQTLENITQQIKRISRVPDGQRQAFLARIGQEASNAAAKCDPAVAEQLLKLADFAHNAAAQMREAGDLAKHDKLSKDDKGTVSKYLQENGLQGSLSVTSPQHPTDTSGSANELYKAAIASVKENRLSEAVQQFEAALDICPKGKVAARQRIQEDLTAVRAQLQSGSAVV